MHSQDSKRTDPFEGYCAFVLLRKISKTGRMSDRYFKINKENSCITQRQN